MNKKKERALEELAELEKELTDRIAETHNVKGVQAERHAFCYYRKRVWKVIELLTPKP